MYIGWRDLVQARGRFVLMAGVVMLIAVLVGLLSGLTRGLAAESTSAITGLDTERLVFSGDEPDFASSRIPLDDVAQDLPDAEPIGIASSRVVADGATEPVAAFGIRPGSDVSSAGDTVAEGAVLTSPVAEALGVSPGDVVEVAGHEVPVAAVAGGASYSHLPVVWLSLDRWQAVTGAGDTATVLATGASEVPEGYTSLSRSESLSAIGSYTSENGSLRLIRGFLFVISALVIGAFFTVWTVQRTRDIAVLKALGASSAFLLRDALGQAAVLLGTGVLTGAAVVLAVAGPVAAVVPFALDAATLAPPLAALVLLGLAGAGLAVRRVTAVDPLTALGSAR